MTKKRLIDANGVIRYLANTGRFEEEDRLFTCDEVKQIIRNAPTVEAEPVRHGHWIARNPDCRGYTDEFMCSECKAITYLHCCAKDCDYDFCPNCGADMDGGAEDAAD